MCTLFLSFLAYDLYLFSNREVTVTRGVDASGEGKGGGIRKIKGWRRSDAGLSLSPCGRINFIKTPFGPGSKTIGERARH